MTICIVNKPLIVAPAASVPVTVTTYVLLFVAVPLTMPVAVLNTSPEPVSPATDNEYGVVPSVTVAKLVMAWFFFTWQVPDFTIGAALTVSVNVAVTVTCGEAESFTDTVIVNELAPVGVPVIACAALRDMPAGSPLALQVSPGLPPVAVNAALVNGRLIVVVPDAGPDTTSLA